MYIETKTASLIFGVSDRALQIAVKRNSDRYEYIKINAGTKSRGGIKLLFKVSIGELKVALKSGKIDADINIWQLEENEWVVSKFGDLLEGDSNEYISDTRTNRAFAKQGLRCDPVSAQWQGEYKSSKDRQEDTTKETSLEPKSSEGSVNDEKYSKTSYKTQEKSLDKSSQNRTIADRESVIGADIRENRANKANLVIDKWDKSDVKNSVSGNFCNIHNMGGFAVDIDNSGVCVGVTSDNRREISKDINDKENKAILEEIRNPHISSGKYNNADDSVDEFQSYAITKEQEASHSLEELFDDMNIKDDKKADAFLKAKVVKLWLKARDRKVKIDAFLQYININNMYGKRVSKGQVYDWARRYANGGIKGLVDERGGNRPLLVELLGYKEKVDELILSSQGKISSYNVYNRLHHYFVSLGLLSHDEFIGKQKEIVAYDAINRYVNRWKKENPTTVLYIEKGYDGAVSSKLAGVGKADWKADFANEYVEIDATTLDLFAKKIRLDLASAIWKMNKEAFRDFEECCERVKENQKRYTVVGLIDVHSGVCSYVIGRSENIYTVKRCLTKYISKFGKPLRVVGDNGKAFKSNEMAGTFESLDIEYLAVRAYSGWLKPYIERSWRSFQDNFSQNLAGFIGHSIEQRQAIEFGFSKMERRLKKGEQTNLKRMLLINDLEKLIDDYIDEFINRRWLDRLGTSPLEAYKSD